MTAQTLVGYLLAGLGTALIAVAGVALVRLPDTYNRANAVTKAAALGVVCVLLGVLVLRPTPFAALALGVGVLMQLLTTPFAAYAVARAAHRSGAPLAPATYRDDLAEDTRHAAGRGPGEAPTP
ncbi:monovalent cation/H(+) antiporter subunit G [Streptomyces durbertensis]|uniref:Monovalent cation/H(+) antiporter subunit G n=1 Tax=Streptomyces durbertensis TaxID=2448886 RepID=A0ABR6EFR2_9ACTN|nr:monovalent cation/H(+) antiporter subunit G [Streptomyces durbertensis]MBB1244152.1 monovalent cation/H(+) antiporter subunit G [Streptomyces durbertensis]